jgi:phosphatidylinositol dimannoside acyltransferase
MAATLAYVAGARLVRHVPEPVARSVFTALGERVYRHDGSGVEQLRANLARVRTDLDETHLDRLTQEAVHSYLRYWCETFRLPRWRTADLVRRTRTVNEHLIRDAYARGRGVVVPLPHMANWDWAGAWACATGMPLATVAERLSPERLYDEFVAYRRTLGMEVLPLTGPDASFRRLVEWVSAGGLVCLLADRDLTSTGVEVSLCGRPARVPRGPAVLARRTGAPLIPATLAYVGEDLELTIHDEVPPAPGGDGIATMMQGVADAFSGELRRHPRDWHMMQKVFVEDLNPGPA